MALAPQKKPLPQTLTPQGISTMQPPVLGQKAANPTDNITQPKNNLPSGQESKITPPNTGLVGSPSAFGNPQAGASYTSLTNIGNEDSPEVKAARKDVEDYQTATADLQGREAHQGYTLQGLSGIQANDRSAYGQILGAKQTALSNALTSQGQRIGALGSAGSLAANQQISPGNFVVGGVSGQDVTGGGVNPFSGGQRQASVTQGQDFQKNTASIGAGRNLANQFRTAIAQNPNFNVDSLNISNALDQLIKNQVSDKNYPGIQSTFNNMISQYAQVLGGEANVLNLIKSANPTSMDALIQSLDSQASAVNDALRTAGTGGGAGNPLTPNTSAPQQSGNVNNNDPLGIR